MTEQTAIELTEFEQVEAAPGTALLRVAAKPSGYIRADERPTLVIDDGRRVHRLAPLPAPPDPGGLLHVAFSAPASLLGTRTFFSLELSNNSVVDLPAPTRRVPRRVVSRPPPTPPGDEQLGEERRRREDAERRAEARRLAISELERRLDAERARRTAAEGAAARADTAHAEVLGRLAGVEAERLAATEAQANLTAQLRREADALVAFERSLAERDSALDQRDAALRAAAAAEAERDEARNIAASLAAEIEEAEARADALAEVVRAESARREAVEQEHAELATRAQELVAQLETLTTQLEQSRTERRRAEAEARDAIAHYEREATARESADADHKEATRRAEDLEWQFASAREEIAALERDLLERACGARGGRHPTRGAAPRTRSAARATATPLATAGAGTGVGGTRRDPNSRGASHDDSEHDRRHEACAPTARRIAAEGQRDRRAQSEEQGKRVPVTEGLLEPRDLSRLIEIEHAGRMKSGKQLLPERVAAHSCCDDEISARHRVDRPLG